MRALESSWEAGGELQRSPYSSDLPFRLEKMLTALATSYEWKK